MSRLLFNLGLLTQIDGAALASYCASYGRWRQAEEDLADSGLLLKNTSGNLIQNPLVGIANQAQRDMVKILVEFGMTPSSRSRVTVAEKEHFTLEEILSGPDEE